MLVRISRSAPIVLQALLGFGILCALVAAPPARGRMMLVPLSPGGVDRLALIATRGGASLVGRGRIPGTLVIDGSRARLALPLLQNQILLLAAIGGCEADRESAA